MCTVASNMQNPRLSDQELVAQMRSVISFPPFPPPSQLSILFILTLPLRVLAPARHSTLIFAALDTTSGAIVRTLQLLSTRPEIQERLRKEITEAQRAIGGEGDVDLDFDALDGLEYLDAVCAEVLRL